MTQPEATIPDPGPASARLRSPWARVLVLASFMLFYLVVGLSVLYFVLGYSVPIQLLVIQVLFLAAFLVLARSPRAALGEAPECARCAGRLFAVRHTLRGRIWTCFSCGYEKPRRRSIVELERGHLGRVPPS